MMQTTSETTGKLDAAIAKAQTGMHNASKDAANEAFKRQGQISRYATLASVLDVVRPAFAAVGVAFTQWPEVDGTRVTVITRLAHDGEWICGAVSARAQGDDPQKIGSAITYLRRYGAMAAAGIAPDDDDDGNAASAPAGRQPERREPPAPKPRPRKEAPEDKAARTAEHDPSWEGDRKAFAVALGGIDLPGRHGIDEVSVWCEWVGMPRPSRMTAEQRRWLVRYLRGEVEAKDGTDGPSRWTDWRERPIEPGEELAP